MAWQKGPGDGYHAAKDDALAICSTLRCHRVTHRDGSVAGYFVEDGGNREFKGARLARDAWGNAFFALGGKYHKGRVILPRRPSGQVEQKG